MIRAKINMGRCQFDQSIADATQAIFLDPNNAAAFSIRYRELAANRPAS